MQSSKRILQKKYIFEKTSRVCRYNFEKTFYIFATIQENIVQNIALRKYFTIAIKIQKHNNNKI